MNPPICKDCKYSSKVLGVLVCSRPTGLLDLTTGKEDLLYRYCGVERLHDSSFGKLQCGAVGRFYKDGKWKKVKLFFSNSQGGFNASSTS